MDRKSWRKSFNADVWYDRFNLVNKLKRFCQACTSRYEFWLSVAVFACLEPILCSRYPKGYILLAQVAVLAVSTLLYFIQIIGVASREWDKIIMIEAMTSLQSLAIPKHMMDFTLLKLFIFFTAEGEYILEFGCLLLGWILIFWHPGLAALRCFRPFRLLWFYEVEVFRTKTEFYFIPLFGEVFVSRGFRVLKFAIKALSALGNEMFRLTNDTKGGLLLMMIFFYSAFVLGAALWVETEGENDACQTLGSCMYVLMRLTFFDGSGFDFAYSLTDGHKILFFIVMMYMCLTSFGILNGLVGIFGTAFAHASDLAFEDEEQHQESKQIEAMENLTDDQPGEQEKNFSPSRGSGKGDGDEDEEVEVYSDLESNNDNGGNFGNNSAVGSPGKPADSAEAERKKRLANMVTGGSKFALKELQKPNSLAGAPRRMTLKDIVKKTVTPRAGAYSGVQVEPFPFPGNELNQQVPQMERKKVTAGGMFNTFQKQKSMKVPGMGMGSNITPITGSSAQLFGGGAANQTTHHLITLTSTVNSLQHKLDRQNELIVNMFEHIQHLSQQLQVVHPELSALDKPRRASKGGDGLVHPAPVDSSHNHSFASTASSFGGTGVSKLKSVLGAAAASTNSIEVIKMGDNKLFPMAEEEDNEEVHPFTKMDAVSGKHKKNVSIDVERDYD